MGRKIIIPEDISDKILKEYNNGRSVLSISKDFTYSYDKIRNHLVQKGIKIRDNSFNSKRYKCNVDYFDIIDIEEKAYWLGFIYADGYLAKNNNKLKLGIAIMSSDIDHLNKFKKNIESTNPIQVYKVSGGYNTSSKYCRITITDQKIISDLMLHGIELKKTGSKNFPNLEKMSKGLIKDFIRGYFDGNGSIRISRKGHKRPYFKLGINGTFEFLTEVKKHLPIKDSDFLDLYQRYPERDNNNYDMDINKIKLVRICLNWLYKGSSIYLDRKYKRYLEFIKEFGIDANE